MSLSGLDFSNYRFFEFTGFHSLFSSETGFTMKVITSEFSIGTAVFLYLLTCLCLVVSHYSFDIILCLFTFRESNGSSVHCLPLQEQHLYSCTGNLGVFVVVAQGLDSGTAKKSKTAHHGQHCVTSSTDG